MKYVKGDRYIEYELILNRKYPFTYEIKNKVLYLNVAKKSDKEKNENFLFNEFDLLYNLINDKEFRKFYGKKVIHYLGKPYFYKTKKDLKDEVEIKKDTIIIHCKENTISQHKAIYKRFLKKAVEQVIVKYYYDAQNDFNDIKMPKITVKGLKSKKCFGYNEPDEICLSTELGRYDEKYIKAIFYHELCHYYVYDHNEQFYEILDKKLENGSKIDKELDKVIVYDEF